MKTQKIINLFNGSTNEESKFATKNWYVLGSLKAKGKYNQNSSIRFETKSIKSSLRDYSDVVILITENIMVTSNSNTHAGI